MGELKKGLPKESRAVIERFLSSPCCGEDRNTNDGKKRGKKTEVKGTLEKLSEKAAMISGAVTGGVLHVLFGLAFWASPGMITGMHRMMWYNSMQYGAGEFSFYGLLGSIVLGIIV